ncbi:glycosyltransferase family 4 protein [Amnibacterium setariae]|uniref:Glycosyltransferase family 1 protein n=1 Tax=Amnibacterium setariae TaxID=2306585 RepID=A0A3A1TYI9_9MICO|nr:glycosyltransferase family 4 protein [Amnibacterium setariae]RIX26090.1 glycosyltransferase family 1 protein [Amnibacterium setariae]
MHIALTGPMTLSLLEPELGSEIPSSGFPFPGTSQLVLDYLRAGHEVTAITTGFDIAEPVRRSSGRLEVLVLPSRSRGRARAFDFFREERHAITGALDAAEPDVIHAHWTYEFGLAARAAAAPALVSVHDWAPAIARLNRHPYWYFRWVMQVACLARRGALVAPSSYIADRVQRWYRQPCAVIPNGVDLAAYTTVVPSHRPVVAMLNVGFTDRKNVETGLRAWPAVRQAHPEAVLALAGPDFEPGGVADRWAREHDLAAGVRFLGPLDPDAVPAFLGDAALFLHTSREESFGVVLVEAMAAGLPVIVGADSGAAPDVVRPAGLAIDVCDPGAVARAVEELLSDPQRRERMSRSGREVAAAYAVERSSAAHLALLREVAGSRRTGTMEQA